MINEESMTLEEKATELFQGSEEDLELEKYFTYHAPSSGQIEKYPILRHQAKKLAYNIMALVPASPERTLAIRKLQECIMWANAGISYREGN